MVWIVDNEFQCQAIFDSENGFGIGLCVKTTHPARID